MATLHAVAFIGSINLALGGDDTNHHTVIGRIAGETVTGDTQRRAAAQLRHSGVSKTFVSKREHSEVGEIVFLRRICLLPSPIRVQLRDNRDNRTFRRCEYLSD